MGYAGNSEPQYIVPTAIATKDDITAGEFVRSRDGLEDLDFYIGDEVRVCGQPLLRRVEVPPQVPGQIGGLPRCAELLAKQGPNSETY
jgi:actin-related protein